tara:strand:+ start:404 stop:1429 length:1026 start_codon:yes stop_codon:yes gene_type:complete
MSRQFKLKDKHLYEPYTNKKRTTSKATFKNYPGWTSSTNNGMSPSMEDFKTTVQNKARGYYEPQCITKSSIKTYYDDSMKLSQQELDDRKEKNDQYYAQWRIHNHSNIDSKLKHETIRQIRNLMNDAKTYYLLTYTFCDGHTVDLKQSKDMCYRIRSKHINMLFQHHKSRKDVITKPARCPRQFFFIEPKNDRYHVHVLMEGIDKDVWIKKLSQNRRLQYIFHRLTQDKLFPRNQNVITEKMVSKYPDYEHHQHYGMTYKTLDLNDDWLISRLLVEFVMHHTKQEKWGIIGVHQSPNCNHAKVMNEAEALEKVEYLNKDEFFNINSPIQGENFCYEYSDLI